MTSQWADALQKALANEAENVPDGWHTREQVQAEHNWTRNQFEKNVARLRTIDAVEMRSYKIVRNGHLRPVPHYHLK